MRVGGTWGVWCEVWGGMTGSREAWLKRDGEIAEFETREAAEAEAKRLDDRIGGNPHRTAEYRYTARVMT